MEAVTSIPQDAKSEGVIVLTDYFRYSSIYLMDMKTGKQTTLPQMEGESIDGLPVSPDGKWLAYHSTQDQPEQDTSLVIAASDGKSYKLVPWKEGWRSISGWLDNERLLITRMPQEQYDPDSLVVVNPFTGEQNVFLPDYPNFNSLDYVDWNLSRMVFDPTLTRVLYTAYQGKLNSVILWDVKNNQLLASVPAKYTCCPQPQWSPDGKQVFLTGKTSEKAPIVEACNQELYSISRDGAITRLTYFTDAFSKVSIGNFRLSPDGQKVAFWLWLASNPGDQLAILDLATGVVTNTCVPGSRHDPVGPPIWSPDGQQLAVLNIDEQRNGHTILVDLAHGWAVRIAENLEPAGWMISP